jgi:putative DNA primase/helicase
MTNPTVKESPRVGARAEQNNKSTAASIAASGRDDNNEAFDASDTDASKRLIETYGEGIRYVPGIGWHVWDGKRWKHDKEKKLLIEMAKQRACVWLEECALSNDGDRDKLIKAARNLKNCNRIKAAVELAESDSRIHMEADALDADPWILNCENGIIDLKTGELKPHDRNSMCSKLAPVAFDPDAKHWAMDTLLETLRATCGDDMPEFLARCFGCCLTGDASVESLFLLQGDGGAGKTTLLESAYSMLGSYAVKLPFESFMLAKNGRGPGAASPDLMDLRGARLAYAAEGDRSASIDAGIVKQLTGGENVTARALYGSPITFKPTWKLWLCSNYDPHCDADDTGIWRRIIKLQFQPIPPESRDPAVKNDLVNAHAARSALLAWMVRGCLDWQRAGGGRKGLAEPESVKALTTAYRDKMDTAGQWWKDMIEAGRITKGENAYAINKDVRDCYEKWCEANGVLPLGVQRFSDFLARQGLTKERKSSGMSWRGINTPTSYEERFRRSPYSH